MEAPLDTTTPRDAPSSSCAAPRTGRWLPPAARLSCWPAWKPRRPTPPCRALLPPPPSASRPYSVRSPRWFDPPHAPPRCAHAPARRRAPRPGSPRDQPIPAREPPPSRDSTRPSFTQNQIGRDKTVRPAGRFVARPTPSETPSPWRLYSEKRPAPHPDISPARCPPPPSRSPTP